MGFRRYVAPTAREALERIRKELGADAVILSNRRTGPNRVEIIAAAQGQMDALVDDFVPAAAPAQPQPAAPARKSVRPAPASAQPRRIAPETFQEFIRRQSAEPAARSEGVAMYHQMSRESEEAPVAPPRLAPPSVRSPNAPAARPPVPPLPVRAIRPEMSAPPEPAVFRRRPSRSLSWDAADDAPDESAPDPMTLAPPPAPPLAPRASAPLDADIAPMVQQMVPPMVQQMVQKMVEQKMQEMAPQVLRHAPPAAPAVPAPQPQAPAAQIAPVLQPQAPAAQIAAAVQPQAPVAQIAPVLQPQAPVAQIAPAPQSQPPAAQFAPAPSPQPPAAPQALPVAQAPISPVPPALPPLPPGEGRGEGPQAATLPPPQPALPAPSPAIPEPMFAQGAAVVAPLPDSRLMAELQFLRSALTDRISKLEVRLAQAEPQVDARAVAPAAAPAPLPSADALSSTVAPPAAPKAAAPSSVRRQVMTRLIMSGFSPQLSRRVGEAAPAALDAKGTDAWLQQVIGQYVRCPADVDNPLLNPGAVALVGPTGVGKTTTLAKIAARFVVRHGAGALGLVTLDSYRMGAHEQLRGYGRILGVPVHTAHDASSLRELLSSLQGRRQVLIDTCGMSQRDPRLGEMLAMLDEVRFADRPVKRVLLINAASHAETLDEVARGWRVESSSGAILTKIDEAARIGGALDALMRFQTPLLGLTNGQRVPEDWHPGNPPLLAHIALKPFGAAFSLDSDELQSLSRTGALIA